MFNIWRVLSMIMMMEFCVTMECRVHHRIYCNMKITNMYVTFSKERGTMRKIDIWFSFHITLFSNFTILLRKAIFIFLSNINCFIINTKVPTHLNFHCSLESIPSVS